MPSLTSETSSVQSPLIKYASQIGWEVISRNEAEHLRGGVEGLLFSSVLEKQLFALNAGLINKENAREVIQAIESVHYDIKGNKNALSWLRGEESTYCEKEDRELNVCVVDYDNPGNNVFQVTDEWSVEGIEKTRRADVVFLINGIPVAVVETKSAVKEDPIWEGLTQIRQYHGDTPAMLALPQVFDITDVLGFHYGVTWNTGAKSIFNWKDEQEGNFETKVKAFFDRERFLKMLGQWILFFQQDDELKKTVLRQHQTRAAERIENRCADNEKTRGLIWHTQGSGKTFTMIKAAEMVFKRKIGGEDPTVILMIDRNELEGQLSGWITSLSQEGGITGVNTKEADTKKDLQELLKSNFRGLIVSMIHKFDSAPAKISERKNIFVFVDEAHRSIEGDLGNYLTGALPNATFIGFTGTPIDKTAHGKGTFKIFGRDDGKKSYLDKYSIKESIQDGTTVELKYKLAPVDFLVPEETLEKEFLSMAETEGLNDIEQLNKVLDKAATLKTFLKSNTRIPLVAEYVAEHFKENVLPLGYKAFFVAVDREACALYKKEFDKLLPQESVKAVYSKAQHDTKTLPLVAEHQLSGNEEDTLRKEFKKPGRDPKLFIVTDKLLTGFDAPILYCMYLDKPMRDHVLLQSISRVNRPYSFEEKDKPCGLIVDFVGIMKNLEKALEFDSKDVKGVIENIELLFDSFEKQMKTAEKYLQIPGKTGDDKAVEKIIEYFSDKEKRDAFIDFFRETQALYEILSPDEKLRNRLEDYKTLSAMYKIVMKRFGGDETPVRYREFQKKTELLIREKVEAFGKEREGVEVAVNSETLEKISKSGGSDKVKVYNLTDIITKLIKDLEYGAALSSMADKARRVKEDFEQNIITARMAVEKLKQCAKEGLDVKQKLSESGKSPRQFFLGFILERAGDSEAEETAAEIDKLFDKFPNHAENHYQKKDLKVDIYKAVGNAVKKEEKNSVIEELIKLDERIKKEVQE